MIDEKKTQEAFIRQLLADFGQSGLNPVPSTTPWRAGPDARIYIQEYSFFAVRAGDMVMAQCRNERIVPQLRACMDLAKPSWTVFDGPSYAQIQNILTAGGCGPLMQNQCFLLDNYGNFSHSAYDGSLDIRHIIPAERPELYAVPHWENALCAERRQLDRLAVGAFARDRLVALAGVSADADELWQIGVDVLPQYRSFNLASRLVQELASAVMALGKIPFYTAAWSNTASVRVALNAGFKPAWCEMYAQSIPGCRLP